MSEQRIERLEGGMQRRAVCLVLTEGCTDGIIVCDTEETANGFIRMEQESGLEKTLKIKSAWMYEKAKEGGSDEH